MAKHKEHVLNVHDDYRIRPAVVELYMFLIGTYLPLRFPKVFKLHEANYEQGQTFMSLELYFLRSRRPKHLRCAS
jgi:hypothetical protein